MEKTRNLQDKLTGTLIGLARATVGNETLVTETTDQLVIESLCSTIPNVNVNNDTLTDLIQKVENEKRRLVPGCYYCTASCGRNDNYDMDDFYNSTEEIRSLKSLILFGIRGIAAYAYHDTDINKLFYKALFAIGMDWDMEELLPIALEVGEICSRISCM